MNAIEVTSATRAFGGSFEALLAPSYRLRPDQASASALVRALDVCLRCIALRREETLAGIIVFVVEKKYAN